jgi:hypothetical protein
LRASVLYYITYVDSAAAATIERVRGTLDLGPQTSKLIDV